MSFNLKKVSNKLLLDPLKDSSCQHCDPSDWSLEVYGLVSTERQYLLERKRKKPKPKPKKRWMEFSAREGAVLSPGAGVSPRSPEAGPPQGVLNFKHIEEAVWSLGPFSFTRFLRSYNATGNSGRPTRKPPGVSVVSRHFSPRERC